jgi:hypothetical protein
MLPAIATLWGIVTVSQGGKLLLLSRYRIFSHMRSRTRHQLFWVTGMSIFPGIGSRFEIFQTVAPSIHHWGRWSSSLHCSLSFFLLSSKADANTVCMNFNISGYYVTFTRIATFFASASLANAFSGLLAAAIDQLDRMGGKPGWAWIFILVLYIECF